MRYENRNYGNKIDFSKSEYNEAEKKIYLRDDKNNFVRFACRLRWYKSQIKSFQNYINDPEQGTWVLELTATPFFHNKLLEALANPEPILRKWEKEDLKKAKKQLKGYMRSVGKDLKEMVATMPAEGEKPATEPVEGVTSDANTDDKPAE